MPRQQQPWIADVRRKLGVLMQSRRLRAGLTQEQLAERAGIHRSTVQRIEGAHNDAKLSDLIAYARALDMSVSELLHED